MFCPLLAFTLVTLHCAIIVVSGLNTSIHKTFEKRNGVYLNPNGLTWRNSELFCQSHCDSHLLSIHSNELLTEMKPMIQNNSFFTHLPTNSFWFGLIQNTQKYTDNSAFDWGTNTSIYPWFPSLNISDQFNCTLFSEYANNYRFQNDVCSNPQKFLCNDCTWNVFTKYVIIDQLQYKSNFSQSEQYCHTHFSTHLASVHSESELNETKLLCTLSDSEHCWIGLKNNKWTDETQTDFSLDISAQNQSGNCTQIIDGHLRNRDCAELDSFLCAMPSELCFPSQWTNVTGFWQWNECQLSNANNGSKDYIALDMSNGDLWKKLAVEYTFLMFNPLQNSTLAGIGLNIRDYNLNSTNIYTIFIAINYYNSTIQIVYNNSVLLTKNTNTLELNAFYALQITLNRFRILRISLNGNEKMMTDLSDIASFPLNYWISSVFLHSQWISMRGKSLFINGETQAYIYTDSPSYEPTNTPSFNPTQSTDNPTLNPSNDPSETPTNIPSQTPSESPTEIPSKTPTEIPSVNPSDNPTKNPTVNPSMQPTEAPYTPGSPSNSPSNPTALPTNVPSAPPTFVPTDIPTTNTPTSVPTNTPTNNPSASPISHSPTESMSTSTHTPETTSIRQTSTVSTKPLVTTQTEQTWQTSQTLTTTTTEHHSTTLTTSEADNCAIPLIELNGITEYSAEIRQLLNGRISIDSSFTFDENCNDIEYELNWMVNIEGTANFNAETLEFLQTYLASQQNRVLLSIDADTYLQTGLEYIFILNFKCVSTDFECDINATHSLLYSQSDLQCRIIGSNTDLNGIKWSDFSALNMPLMGTVLSEDSQLQIEWNCALITNDKNTSQNCDYLFQSTDASNTIVMFDRLERHSNTNTETYNFSFALQMSDINSDRKCIDSVYLFANIMNANSNVPTLLIISIAQMKHTITINDKVRIIANVMNDNKEYNIPIITTHRWYEMNGLLSETDIIKYSETTENSLSLVLMSDILTEGQTYLFKLEMFHKTEQGRIMAYGNSTIATVFVTEPPQIIPNSFQMFPNCSDGIIEYESIARFLEQNRFSLSIEAETAGNNNISLFYQFMYRVNGNNYSFNYLHSNLLSNPYINDIALSVGNIEILANVYGSDGSMVTDTITCDIQLTSYDSCPDLSEFETNLDLFTNDYEKYSLILKESLIYLEYIFEYESSEECMEYILDTIMDILTDETEEIFDDLCVGNRENVILFAQVMTLWTNIFEENDGLHNNEQLQTSANKLLFSILDPCKYISETIEYDMEQLTLSADSMLTDTAKIYHISDLENEVNKYLSLLVTDTQYNSLLYALINSSLNANIDNLIFSTLFISSLTSISTAIPGETVIISPSTEFSLYSIRSINENITVSVQNMNVFIPQNILQNSNDNNGMLQYTDTILIGITHFDSQFVETEFDGNYTLSNETVSITIMGDTNTSHLASDINMTFSYDSDGEYKCVWYDMESGTWSDDGCVTFISDANNEIQCLASHLTTFAYIQSVQSGQFSADMQTNNYFWIINLSFAIFFLILCVYIMVEIYPFFVDKILNWKQASIVVMTILCIISFLYFINCLNAYNSGTLTKNSALIIFIELIIQLLYFVIYCLLFYSWFILANSTNMEQSELEIKIKKILFIAVVAFVVFTLLCYVLIVIIESPMFISVLQILWSLILLLICVSFAVYAYYVGKILLLTAKISSTQKWGSADMSAAKRLLLINALIVLFFVIHFGISVYFSIYPNTFTSIDRIINVSLNLLFICVLCWMYRVPMRRLIKFEANADYHKYHCCCKHKWFGFAAHAQNGKNIKTELNINKNGKNRNNGLPSNNPHMNVVPTASNTNNISMNRMRQTITAPPNTHMAMTRRTITAAPNMSAKHQNMQSNSAMSHSNIEMQTQPNLSKASSPKTPFLDGSNDDGKENGIRNYKMIAAHMKKNITSSKDVQSGQR